VNGSRPNGAEVLSLDLLPGEVEVLRSLVGQLRRLVDAPAPSDDPLDNWAAEAAALPLDHEDPVIRRLFPGAYADADLDAEYRRLAEPGLRADRDADARLVERGLAGAAAGRVNVPRADVWAWLRTLNVLRLALAARLGIEDDDSLLGWIGPDDPRHALVQTYCWLGYLLESLLAA
jgi:hypothetical protein